MTRLASQYAEQATCLDSKLRLLMARVLIIGASKGIGLETVRSALEAGHKVRALARSATSISLAHPQLEKVRGNALVREDVEAALQGVDVVIQTLGVSFTELFGPVHLFSDATRVLVAAMAARGVKRLICVTGFGAGDSRTASACCSGCRFTRCLAVPTRTRVSRSN